MNCASNVEQYFYINVSIMHIRLLEALNRGDEFNYAIHFFSRMTDYDLKDLLFCFFQNICVLECFI